MTISRRISVTRCIICCKADTICTCACTCAIHVLALVLCRSFVRWPAVSCNFLILHDYSRRPSTRYKYHLALIVVVDKENHTQIAMQALLSHERTESFIFLFEMFRELCAKAHPQVNEPSFCRLCIPTDNSGKDMGVLVYMKTGNLSCVEYVRTTHIRVCC